MFNAWWVARSEVRRLEGLGRLVMGFDVQVGFFANLSSKHCGIVEWDLVLCYFCREFDSRMEKVSSFNESSISSLF